MDCKEDYCDGHTGKNPRVCTVITEGRPKRFEGKLSVVWNRSRCRAEASKNPQSGLRKENAGVFDSTTSATSTSVLFSRPGKSSAPAEREESLRGIKDRGLSSSLYRTILRNQCVQDESAIDTTMDGVVGRQFRSPFFDHEPLAFLTDHCPPPFLISQVRAM